MKVSNTTQVTKDRLESIAKTLLEGYAQESDRGLTHRLNYYFSTHGHKGVKAVEMPCNSWHFSKYVLLSNA